MHLPARNHEHDQIVTDAFTLPEFMRAFRIGRTTMYAEIKAGRLRVRKLGAKSLILKSDAIAWAQALPLGVPSPALQAAEQF